MRTREGPDVISTRKAGFQPVRFGEDLFFWRSLHFGRENRLNLLKDRSNLGQDRLMFFPASKTVPPMQIPGYAPAYY